MFDYIVLPTCTIAEYSALQPLVSTPFQTGGYCRVRLAEPITPTGNVIEVPKDGEGNDAKFQIGELEDGTPIYLGEFA